LAKITQKVQPSSKIAGVSKDVFERSVASVAQVKAPAVTAPKVIGKAAKHFNAPMGIDGADGIHAMSRATMRERLLESLGIFDDTTHAAKNIAGRVNNKLLRSLGHSNLHDTINGGYRGKMFAQTAEIRNLPKFKEAGIQTVIDLRAEGRGVTEKLAKACRANGLEYFNFPVVIGDGSLDEVTIKRLPKFIELINKGKFMIGCSTGNQRTDISLAMHHCFTPPSNNSQVPLMLGYSSNKGVSYGKIDETLSRIFKKLPEAHKKIIGGAEGFKAKRATLKWLNG
jgi:hypothetical protein